MLHTALFAIQGNVGLENNIASYKASFNDNQKSLYAGEILVREDEEGEEGTDGQEEEEEAEELNNSPK